VRPSLGGEASRGPPLERSVGAIPACTPLIGVAYVGQFVCVAASKAPTHQPITRPPVRPSAIRVSIPSTNLHEDDHEHEPPAAALGATGLSTGSQPVDQRAARSDLLDLLQPRRRQSRG